MTRSREVMRSAGIVLVVVVVSLGGFAIQATRGKTTAQISMQCWPTTEASDWYDTFLTQNTTTGAYSWSGKRDFTITCHRSLEVTPCRLCHAYTIESWQGPLFGYELVDEGMSDFSAPCDQVSVKTRTVTASNLKKCRWYRISSALAERPCDGMMPFGYVETHEFPMPCDTAT